MVTFFAHSLFPSLSLPFLSLSLIETHTHTHTTHTLTQSKSGRYELILRLLTFILRLEVNLRVQIYPSLWRLGNLCCTFMSLVYFCQAAHAEPLLSHRVCPARVAELQVPAAFRHRPSAALVLPVVWWCRHPF